MCTHKYFTKKRITHEMWRNKRERRYFSSNNEDAGVETAESHREISYPRKTVFHQHTRMLDISGQKLVQSISHASTLEKYPTRSKSPIPTNCDILFVRSCTEKTDPHQHNHRSISIKNWLSLISEYFR